MSGMLSKHSSCLLRFILPVVAITLSACSSTPVSPVPASVPAARAIVPHAAATAAPLAYVAESCDAAVSSCSAPNGMVEVVGGAASATPITSGINSPQAIAMDKTGNLYVGGSTSPSSGFISVYAPNSTTPARTISNIIGIPEGLAFNGARLFMVEQIRFGCCQFVGEGWVYKAGASTPYRQLQRVSGFPFAPVFDKTGTGYIANFTVFPGYISVYPPGANYPSQTILNGVGFPLGNGVALTPSGDLVLLSEQINHTANVNIYTKGSLSPSLTITKRLPAPTGVAVDAKGNIYVANDGPTPNTNDVVMYAAGKTNVARTIRTGINYPVALAFDGAGRLYVANSPSGSTNTVTVYAPGGSTPIATYTLKQRVAKLLVPK
jgi:hypothetical protein